MTAVTAVTAVTWSVKKAGTKAATQAATQDTPMPWPMARAPMLQIRSYTFTF